MHLLQTLFLEGLYYKSPITSLDPYNIFVDRYPNL